MRTPACCPAKGLLTDLTDVAKARGWDKILSPSLQTTCIYNDKGIMGSGKWYGVSDYGEYVMVYYNTDMFAKYNIQVPTTFDEFVQALATFKAAGITPIATAACRVPGPADHLRARAEQGQPAVDQQLPALNSNPFDFNGPEMTFAATTYADWVAKGYIAKTSTSAKAEDMGVAFENGTNPIMISGSWWYGRFMKEISKFKWGIFLFPGNTFDLGSGGNLWVIPTAPRTRISPRTSSTSRSRRTTRRSSRNAGASRSTPIPRRSRIRRSRT
jgi:raffinose/stachyose/melibiose transport system substrate-binding protein